MKYIYRLILSFTILSLYSCTTIYYIPNTQNIPVIDKKGKTSLTIAGSKEQGEILAAYGVGESIALMSDIIVIFPQTRENGDGGSGYLVDLGAGYFKPLNMNLLFDSYALVGFGKFENHFPSTISAFPLTTGTISANLLRLGIQPSLSYYTEFFSITGSARFTSLSYLNIKGSLNHGNIDQIGFLESNRSNFLIEPAITIRGGIEKVKLQFQYLHSFNVSNPEFPQTKDIYTLGLNFRF